MPICSICLFFLSFYSIADWAICKSKGKKATYRQKTESLYGKHAIKTGNELNNVSLFIIGHCYPFVVQVFSPEELGALKNQIKELKIKKGH
jgi:hypothetical protein